MFDFTLCVSTSKDSARGHLKVEKACQGIMAGYQDFCLHAFLIQENHSEGDLLCYPKIPLGLELREPESSVPGTLGLRVMPSPNVATSTPF